MCFNSFLLKAVIFYILVACLFTSCQRNTNSHSATEDPSEISRSAQNKQKSTSDTLDQHQRDSLVLIGVEIAMEGQKALGFHLMRELQQNGALEALEFCNLQALALTDSVASKYNARVQRVSDRNRNPVNAANPHETKLIKNFQNDLQSGKEADPVLRMEGDSVSFYYPLITNSLCLQCHGKRENMDREVREEIMRLYPQDMATGYSENQVRGIWKIKIKR